MRSPTICRRRPRPAWKPCWPASRRCETRKYLASDSHASKHLDHPPGASNASGDSARLLSRVSYDALLASVFLALFRIWVRDVFPPVDHRICPQQTGHVRHCAAQLLPGMDTDWLGGRFGLGGEERRSDGCAVRSSAARSCRKAGLVSVVVFITLMSF